MDTYFVDAAGRTPDELHRSLQMMLGLPDYYGRNADALYDCLSERKPIRLFILDHGTGTTAEELERICAVVRDLGGEIAP